MVVFVLHVSFLYVKIADNKLSIMHGDAILSLVIAIYVSVGDPTMH